MCTGLEIAALAASAAGTAASAKAQSDARSANQSAANRQTGISAEEFNAREAASRENFARDLSLSKGEYDKRTGIEDQSATDLRNVTQEGQRVQSQAELDDIDRSSKIIMDAIGGRSAATNKAFDERAAAREDTDRLRAAESGRQRGFQSAADSAVDSTIGNLSEASGEARRGTSEAQRVSDLLNAPSAAAPDVNVTPAVKAAIDAQRARVVNAANTTAQAGAKVASYGDLLDANKRDLAGLGTNLSTLANKAAISIAPLNTELGVANLRGQQAGERADDTLAALGRETDANLGISAEQKRAIQVPSVYRTGALSDTISGLTDKLVSSSNDYEAGSNAASDRYAQTVGQASGTYEGNMRGLTDSRIRGQPTSSTLGTLLNTLGSYGFTASQGPNAQRINSWISRPFTSSGGGYSSGGLG